MTSENTDYEFVIDGINDVYILEKSGKYIKPFRNFSIRKEDAEAKYIFIESQALSFIEITLNKIEDQTSLKQLNAMSNLDLITVIHKEFKK